MNREKYLDIVLNFLCEESGVKNNCNTFDDKYDLWRNLVSSRVVKDIPNDILEAEDKFLRFQLFNRKLTNGEELKSVNELLDINIKHGDKICLWKGDITSIYCDAIVNSACPNMLGIFECNKQSVDNNIHCSSGMRLRKKCDLVMQGTKLNISDVIITRAYNLPCDFIIHVVGPNVDNEITEDNISQLQKAYFNVLECAKNNLIKTLVICCISTGYNNFPIEKACEISINEVVKYLDINDKFFDKVIFNVFDDDKFDIYEDKFRNLKNTV